MISHFERGSLEMILFELRATSTVYMGPPLWGRVSARTTRGEVVELFGWAETVESDVRGLPGELIYRAGEAEVRFSFQPEHGPRLSRVLIQRWEP